MPCRPTVLDSAWQPLRDKWNMLLVHAFEAYIETRPATADEIAQRVGMELQCASGDVTTNPHAWARWEQHFVAAEGSHTMQLTTSYWCQPPAAWQPPASAAHTCQSRWTYLREALSRHEADEEQGDEPDYGPVRLALDVRLEAQHMYWEAQLVRCQLDSGVSEMEWQTQEHKQIHGDLKHLHDSIREMCDKAAWRQNVVSGIGTTSWSTFEGGICTYESW